MILELTKSVQAGIRKEKQYEVISNHLANANTNGYKKDVLSFDRVMKATLTKDFSQGDLHVTDNKLDVALGNPGFFKIETPQGIRYTRDGSFTRNTNGEIVTHDGHTVLGDGGPISVDGSEIYIGENGSVQVDGLETGRLSVVNFPNPQLLERDGKNLFSYTGNPQDEFTVENRRVTQGAIEGSNVTPVVEMAKMIESQRLYESFQKLVHSFDELDAKANDIGSV